MSDIKVAIDALRYDAKIWDNAADDLADPIRAVEPLELNGSPDVMLYGADIGIDTTYNNARIAIEELLGKASGYFESCPIRCNGWQFSTSSRRRRAPATSASVRANWGIDDFDCDRRGG